MQKNKFIKRRGTYAVPQSIGLRIERLLEPFIRSHGFSEARIILDWEKIMGVSLASQTQPQKISFLKGQRGNGTLTLLVTSAIAPEILHLSPQIIERINGYFGYKAIEKIVLKHGLIKSSLSQHKENASSIRRKLEENEIQEIRSLVAEIPDENLKNVLSNLGVHIMEKKNA
ncbi:MAG: DUF721 domain-containing protein [Proteobacteria bacterium]|nr:DUF721 domain-containing protein [Pseudomonadota bacterium]